MCGNTERRQDILKLQIIYKLAPKATFWPGYFRVCKDAEFVCKTCKLVAFISIETFDRIISNRR